MSRTISRRLLGQSPSTLLSKDTSAITIPIRCLRQFSSTPTFSADGPTRPPPQAPAPFPRFQRKDRSTPTPTFTPPRSSSLAPNAKRTADSSAIMDLFNGMVTANQVVRHKTPSRINTQIGSDGSFDAHMGIDADINKVTSWQMHIYATKHNVHITIVRPPNWTNPVDGTVYGKNGERTVALSLSAGNLGFRKSGRKHYDSAFQLASYVFGRMQEQGMTKWIETLEVSLRGYGAGREACTKALLGTEGRYLRGKVVKVTDATRLKFGGTRSKKPRRLG